MKGFFNLAAYYIKATAWGGCIGFTITDLFGSVARVDGVSMQPTLNPSNERHKDWIIFSSFTIRDYNFQRGDVVCIASPRGSRERLIKRIIGLEGDIVRTLNYKNPYVRIPEGHCWVEGDHHSQSMDSNFFGPIPLALIIGKASYIVWPPKRWSPLKSELPVDRKPY